MDNHNTYDELKYYSSAFSFCNIAHLESQGYFWGLTPVPIAGARVLELGSSFGGNLISQALYYPKTQFIGIDLSESQIQQGNQIIQAMGLNNITLLAKNILDIDNSFGTFDYIIVHGIYSWVPDNVKDKILSICRQNLSSNGIAYISYNTYPGWKNKDVARDIMLFANKYQADLPLLEKNRRGKIITKMFADTISNFSDIKEKNLSRLNNFNNIQEKDDHYVAHEYLETFNDPLYVHEFVERAQAHKLSYIGDIELQLSYISWTPASVQEMLNNLAPDDYVAREQCLDYLYDTEFRRSLLCHNENHAQINRTEEIQKALLARYTYLPKIRSVDLNRLFNNAKLINVIQYFLENGKHFTIQNIFEYIETRQLTEEIQSNSIYSAILYLIILGHIQPYMTPYYITEFEEGKSYVPERFIRYVDVMLKGAGKFISLADMYNRNFNFLDHLHHFIMQQLATVKTKAQLFEALQKYLIHSQTETLPEDDELKALIDTICHNLSVLGYLINK